MAEGSLQVQVVRARGLESSSGISADPYAFLSCGPGLHRRTRTIRDGGANPVWNQSFLFEIPGGVYVPELIVAIYDDERHGKTDGFIGMAIISLDTVYTEKQIGPTAYKIQLYDGKQQQGDIELGFKFFPPKMRPGALHVHLVQANGLMKSDVFDKIDPYAIIAFGKQSSKSRKLKGAGGNPVWDETFVFEIDSDECQLVIKLFDKDRFTRDDPLGNAVVPLTKVFAEGRVPPTFYKVFGKQGRPQGEVQVGLQYSPKIG